MSVRIYETKHNERQAFTLNHLDTRKLTWYGREDKRVIDSEMQIIEE